MINLFKKPACGWPFTQLATLLVLALATILLTVGYLVTPVLFTQLPAKQAGDLAGELFTWVSLIVLSTLFLLITFYSIAEKSVSSVKSLLLSLLLMATLRFWITPWMADIKGLYPLGIDRDSIDWPLFASLHGLYQIVYLSVIFLLLFWSVKHFLRVQIQAIPNE